MSDRIRRSLIAALLAFAGGGLGLSFQNATQAVEDVRQVRAFLHSDELAGERIIQLPEDGHAWHVSVFVSEPQTARDKELLAWFRSDSRLAAFAAQVHFHETSASTKTFQAQWQHRIQSLPAVVVQRSDGKVVCASGGNELPPTASQLADVIARVTGDCCPRPRPPQPQPAPSPVPDPIPWTPVMPGPPNDPLIVPPPEGDDNTAAIIMAIIGSILGAGGSLLANVKREAKL